MSDNADISSPTIDNVLEAIWEARANNVRDPVIVCIYPTGTTSEG